MPATGTAMAMRNWTLFGILGAFLGLAGTSVGWGQAVGSGEDGEAVGLRVHRAEFGPGGDSGEVKSGFVAIDPRGERRVIVSGRHRPEIWKITAEGEVEDTGYFVSLGTPGRVRVEWEQSEPEDWGELAAGVLPWRSTGERFGAFALSDWMVARKTAVSLPFFGEEDVGFRFRAGGVVGAKLKDGGEVAGTWWWSRGRLHLQLEGLDEVATYEWRALAVRVGWSAELKSPVAAGPSVRPFAVTGGRAPPSRSLPGAAAACPRDVLARLLASATERSDVVSALAIEKETLELCAERQGLVVNIVQLDRQLEAAVEDRESKTNKPARRAGLKSVAQLAGARATPPAPAKPPETAVEAPAREAAAVPERVESPPRRVVEPVEAKAAYSWFSLLGRPGRLLAGVTDGSRTWFVSEGDVLPRGGVVERISGRPPGVEVAGLGLLPWTGKPVAVADVAGADTGVGRETRPGGVVDPGEVRTAQRSALAGHARVVDGDTVEVGGARVRLWGIDAPEKRQECRSGRKTWACGGLAEAALRSRAAGLRCEEKGKDRYGRVLGVCFEGPDDINAWLVSEGWALAYRQFAKVYVPEETEARARKRGIHRGEFVAPWDWRRGKRLPALEAKDGEAADLPPLAPKELPPLPNAETSR